MGISDSDQQQNTNKDNSDKSYRQLLAALVINSSSFLQGASISTSSIILHQLQRQHYNDGTNFVGFDNATTISKELLTDSNNNLFENFRVSEETGSWIGTIVDTN